MIPAASLDAAFLVNVLNQSQHQEKIIAEAVRLLKSNGVLIIVDWERLDVPFAPHGCCPPQPETVKEMAAAAGLRLDSTFPTSAYHFGFKFFKNPAL
jgi:ubiquinone/menaquinone biosynthesis C-methylase UbiE